MTHKTKNSYITLLTVLKEEVLARLNKHLSPEYNSTDYEQAAIGAIGNVFPNTKITGCLFHYGQALWRKLQSKGLASRKQTKNSQQNSTPISLAFVPEQDMKAVF